MVYAIVQLVQWGKHKQFPELKWWGWIGFVIGLWNMLTFVIAFTLGMVGGYY